MPIYEYQCDGCAKVFEVFQKVSDPPPAQHDCGSTAVHRVLSNTSFRLKGTGWYATDYGNKSKSSGDEGGHGKHKKDDAGGDKAEGGGSDKKTTEAKDTSKADAAPKKPAGGGSGGGTAVA